MATPPPAPEDHVTFETAAQHATLDVPVFDPHRSAGEVRAELAGRKYETVALVIVCEGRGFSGVVRLEDLLAAPAATRLAELMDPNAPSITPGADQELAAWEAARSGKSALAVVDPEGRFAGVIPPHRLLGVLMSEHEEDLSRLGGFLKDAASARTAGEERVRRRFWHRVPWLLVGLAGAMLAADFVGGFETQLREKVMLAFFIPGIVYLADAVGTQTETVVVRGLSVGVRMSRMVQRELLTGLVLGLVLAAAAFPLIWWRWGDREVALCVGLALWAACSTATLAAMVLPWLLGRFGLDPAFGSGPLATVVQDLLSILIYLGIVLVVVK
jgi:magnesium transporter